MPSNLHGRLLSHQSFRHNRQTVAHIRGDKHCPGLRPPPQQLYVQRVVISVVGLVAPRASSLRRNSAAKSVAFSAPYHRDERTTKTVMLVHVVLPLPSKETPTDKCIQRGREVTYNTDNNHRLFLIPATTISHTTLCSTVQYINQHLPPTTR